MTMTYAEIVDKLIGPVNPVGETNADDKRFENLKALCDLSEHITRRISEVATNKDRHEYSIKRAGEFADKFLSANYGV